MTSSLWFVHPKLKNKGKIKASSLNLILNSIGVCHNPTLLSNKKYIPYFFKAAKETSPRTFFHGYGEGRAKKSFLRGKTGGREPFACKASMTVEAALVLPLFLLFFLILGSSIETFRFHSKMEMAFWEVGRETCIYGTVIKGSEWLGEKAGEPKDLTGTVANLALSYGYLRGRVETLLGKKYLEDAPIQKGGDALIYLGSDLVNEEDEIEFWVTYAVRPKWAWEGFRSFYLRNHYFGRLWTGFDLEAEDTGIYYLTENAEVFHRDLNCSHLKLNPVMAEASTLEDAVNQDGRHYRPCAFCVKGVMPRQVWISPEGDCYHYKRDCSGLKRIIRTVTWSEAQKYRPCSRCGSGKE